MKSLSILLLFILIQFDSVSCVRVRFCHASPNITAVDVYLNSKLLWQDVAYTSVSNYTRLDLPDFQNSLKLTPHGQSTSLLDTFITLWGQAPFTLALGDKQQTLQPFVFNDISRPFEGRATVRFYHLSPDTPSVDIVVAKTNRIIFTDVSLGDEAMDALLDPSTVNWEIRLSGTEHVVLRISDLMLKKDTEYSLFLEGLFKGVGTQALTILVKTEEL
eukprot:TRINITY_DN9120_c0_g1_i1.p1 TRINITY_DN9120_c0_g1~~TRINITY_DN9120_c0_g1_i1.p1  ORF type:complete len:224 (+),score=24.09 TRINITY_DN9120_c0_g1_i1:24-674(+)